MKAVLALNGAAFPYTHDLTVLIRILARAGTPIPTDLAGAEVLTLFGARLRYADAEDAILVERRSGLSWAETAVEWARVAFEGRA